MFIVLIFIDFEPLCNSHFNMLFVSSFLHSFDELTFECNSGALIINTKSYQKQDSLSDLFLCLVNIFSQNHEKERFHCKYSNKFSSVSSKRENERKHRGNLQISFFVLVMDIWIRNISICILGMSILSYYQTTSQTFPIVPHSHHKNMAEANVRLSHITPCKCFKFTSLDTHHDDKRLCNLHIR